ncbi:sodium-and chloride-dependent transporter [Helicobacter sp. CLO-3]|uniref:sodium-dependent transporter n=1 Tax=unclassified Helicobacter TaxID=2593540 RepID=UPI0008053349|nr:MULTISPECIES: sodium-dependent transporter [unclassified Helicobacter]OBV28644.1 sodium-and chloride-dependent transporter [Helicobacter sp. CLO-3]OHU83090.1 sodium-and chloride-dependent transporter [Helicobacter sp. CLO-3]
MGKFSKIGFILATLGSSIGLGHIWRFPYMAGQMGGGAFVLLFLLLAFFIGVSLLVADMLIGNKGKRDVVGCFEALDPSPRKLWRLSGFVIIGGPIILSFYAVILGWILYYLLAVSFALPSDMPSSQAIFEALMSERIFYQILGFAACLFITALIVSFGIKDGIERLNLVLMPLLFVLFIGLLIYAAFQPSFMQAVHFLFDFKYQDLTPSVLMSALAQMFFSLSLGVGTIITYAAASQEKQNLFKSALWVVIPGIAISLIAGLIIFTFFFGYSGEAKNLSDNGAKLVFISLPLIFSEFGAVGQILSVAFLSALLFAGITSTVSLLEPSVYYLTQRRGFNRIGATFGVSVVVFALGLLALYSMSLPYGAKLSVGGESAFFWLDFVSSSIIMPIGALISVVFVGFIIGKERLKDYTKDFFSPIAFGVWLFILRYIAPIVIIGILAYKILADTLFAIAGILVYKIMEIMGVL